MVIGKFQINTGTLKSQMVCLVNHEKVIGILINTGETIALNKKPIVSNFFFG